MDMYFNRGNEFKPKLLDMYDKFNIDKTYLDPALSFLLPQLNDEQLIELSKELFKTNEGLRDKMTPKSEEDIRKSLEYLTDPKEMMIKGIEYGQMWLVQKAIDRDVWIGEYIRIYHSFKSECHSFLEYATSIGNLKIVKLLMDNGASEYGKDVDAAVEIAQRDGRFDLLKILLPYREWDEIENRYNKIIKNR